MGRAQSTQRVLAQTRRRASADTVPAASCVGSGLAGIREYSNPTGNCCVCGKWLRLSKHGKAPRHKALPRYPVIAAPPPRVDKPEIIAFLQRYRRDLLVGELLDLLVLSPGDYVPERP
jgi:hypothetical protein